MGISKMTSTFSSPFNFNTVLFPDFLVSFLALSLVALTVVWTTRWASWTESGKRKKNLPPGPKGNIGLVSYLNTSFNQTLEEQVKSSVKQYGSLVGMFSSLFQAVTIQDYQTLRLAFSNPAVLRRPPQKYLNMFPGDNPRGIATTSGETWKEMRKFTVSQLRSLGLGKKSLEPAISQQVEECIAILRTKQNEPFSTKHFFDILAFNVLWQIISSQKLSHGDPQAAKLMMCIERITESVVHFSVLSRHPKLGAWLLPLFGMKNPFPPAHKNFLKFTSEFLNSRLKSSASTEGSSGDHDDFTEAFLQKIHSTTDENSPFYGQAGYEHLQETIRDFFMAGTETSGTTLSWALLFLALHPEKQEKLQREIDQVLGNRPPTLSDRPMMKYTEAVIHETLRKSSNLPLGLPYAVIQDTKIGEFDVPKGTWVIPGIYAIHHCEVTWGDPYIFRPERFLSADEATLIKHEAFVPFGSGKRTCPGAALAFDELFMFITRIFQEFTITWNPAEPKPTMDAKSSCTAAPFSHTLIVKERPHYSY